MINVSRHIVTDRSWQDLVSLAGFNREGVESGEILADEGDVLHALLYSQLFWPSFIEESSAIFLGVNGNTHARVTERMSDDGRMKSWSEFVDSFNVIEIEHLFRNAPFYGKDFYAACRSLGQILIEIWGARLREKFPDRRFLLRLVDSDRSMDLRIEVTQAWPDLIPPDGWQV